MSTGGSRQSEHSPTGNGDGALDAYLDGLLVGPERLAFESRLSQDPALRAAVESQRRIDGALRSLFVIPTPLPLPTNGKYRQPDSPPPESPPTPGPSATSATAAAAGAEKGKIILAAVLLLLSAAITAWQFFPDGSGGGAQRVRATPEEVYQRQVLGGFTPDVPYLGAQHLSAIYHTHLGRGLSLRAPKGVTPLGVASGCGVGHDAVVLLARVNGREVMVIASTPDCAGPDPGGAAAGPDGGLRRFRRQVGGLVLDELSPLDRPHLLDRFEPTPPPAAP
jgi:hypothetical protein